MSDQQFLVSDWPTSSAMFVGKIRGMQAMCVEELGNLPRLGHLDGMPRRAYWVTLTLTTSDHE
jgi:hypothetical protein